MYFRVFISKTFQYFQYRRHLVTLIASESVSFRYLFTFKGILILQFLFLFREIQPFHFVQLCGKHIFKNNKLFEIENNLYSNY